jgi:hypothetical protein
MKMQPALPLLLCSLALFLTTARAQDAPVLVEQTALNGRVTVLVPEGFAPMSAEMMAMKYPSENRPTEVLTNERGSINVVFNHTQTAMRPEQVAKAHSTLEQMFRSFHPSANWNRSEVIQRNGRSSIVLDLWTPAIDTKVRNIILGTSVDGRFLLVGFNVTRELEVEWGAIGERIIDSIRIHH